MNKEDKAKLARWIQEQVRARLEDTHADLKPAVMRRAVRRIGLEILGNWCMAWDPVHLGSFRAAMVVEESVRDRLGPLIDLAVEQLFHGHVIPVQRLLVLIDESASAWLGKCVCRSSKVTQDLRKGDDIYMIADEDTIQTHLDNLLEAYHTVKSLYDAGETDEPTDTLFLEALAEVDAATGSPRERLEIFFERTYPFWELLLEHQRFTQRWRRNMAQHNKAKPIHRTLLKAIVQAQYDVRGAIFTGMEVVNEPYCVCTCPGPENDRGCSLVNWHYYSRLDHALYPNEDDFYGQRKDAAGRVLPCNRFEERKTRPCLGCGCEHQPQPPSSDDLPTGDPT